MAEIVQSLFGVTPDMYRQQQAAEADRRALAMAQLTPFQRAEFNIGRGAYQLAGALGGEDPQLKLISLRQSIARQIDPTDLASIQAGVQQLQQANDPQGAMMLAQELRKAQESGALVQQRTREGQAKSPIEELIRSGKYTPASIRDYAATGDPASLVLAAPEKERSFGPEREAIAMELYGKPFAQLTQTEIAAVNKRAAPATQGQTFGVEREAVARELYGKPFAELTTAEIAAVNKRVEAAKPSTTITNVLPAQIQEKAEAGERGKMLVADFNAVKTQATVAARILPAIESNLATLDRGFDTGFGTEVKAAGARVLTGLGVKDAEKFATDSQTFLANAASAVLQRQLEQKGPQTEADAARITQTGAQLGNTKEANRFLLSIAKAQFKRDIAQRNFYSDWFAKMRTYDGAEEAWFSGEGGKSLFESPELKRYAGPSNAAQQIPAAAPAPAAAASGMPSGFRVLRQTPPAER